MVGPMVPAVFLALWTALLARWWAQRASVLRCLLFLVGLGLTFNLGRDITLLVLWPIVFGYGIVRVVEHSFAGGKRRRVQPVNTRSARSNPTGTGRPFQARLGSRVP